MRTMTNRKRLIQILTSIKPSKKAGMDLQYAKLQTVTDECCIVNARKTESVKITLKAVIEEAGEMLLPINTLIKLLKTLKSEFVILSGKVDRLTVENLTATHELEVLWTEEYPIEILFSPPPAVVGVFKVDAQDFLRALSFKVSPAHSDHGYDLKMITIRIFEGKMNVLGLDNRQANLSTLGVETMDSGEKFEILLSRDSVNLCAKVLKGSHGSLTLTLGDGVLRIASNEKTLTARLSAGRMPVAEVFGMFEKIPKETIKVSVKVLLGHLADFRRSGSNIKDVTFSIKENALTLTGRGTQGTYPKAIHIDDVHSFGVVNTSGTYSIVDLTANLKNFPSEDCLISFDEERFFSCTTEDGKFNYLLMPVIFGEKRQ